MATAARRRSSPVCAPSSSDPQYSLGHPLPSILVPSPTERASRFSQVSRRVRLRLYVDRSTRIFTGYPDEGAMPRGAAAHGGETPWPAFATRVTKRALVRL